MKIRILTDIDFRWELLVEGAIVDLSKLDFSIEIITPIHTKEAIIPKINNNIATFTYKAKYVGDYIMTAYLNRCKEKEAALDVKPFSAVRYSWDEDHEYIEGIEFNEVNLTGNISRDLHLEDYYKKEEADRKFVDLSTEQNILAAKTFSAGINMNGTKIRKLRNPESNDDAATKKYVDDSVSNKVDKSNVYAKSETDELLNKKLDTDDEEYDWLQMTVRGILRRDYITSVDLSDYKIGQELDNCLGVYTYNGYPCHTRTVIHNSKYYILVCAEHGGTNGNSGQMYFVFTDKGGNMILDATYTSANVLDWIKRAFNESTATASYPGLLSADYYKKLRDLPTKSELETLIDTKIRAAMNG